VLEIDDGLCLEFFKTLLVLEFGLCVWRVILIIPLALIHVQGQGDLFISGRE